MQLKGRQRMTPVPVGLTVLDPEWLAVLTDNAVECLQ